MRLGGDDIGGRLSWLSGRLDNQGLSTLPDNQTLVRRLLLRIKLLLLAKRRADILQRGTVCGLLLCEHLPGHLLGLVHHWTHQGLWLLKILLLLLLHWLLLLEILLHIGLKVILLLLLLLWHHIIKGCIVETATSQIILVLVLVKWHLVVKAYHVLLLVHGLVQALLPSHHVGLVHALVHHPPTTLGHLVHPTPVNPVSLRLLVVHPLLIVLLLLVWLLLVLKTALLLVLLVVPTTSKEAATSKHGRAEFLLASGS